MTKEELLKSRYKVIADYPYSVYDVGYIIYADTPTSNTEKYYAEYPHIFKKLEWFQDREESDMPEYVKVIKTGNVVKYSVFDSNVVSYFDFEGKSTVLPATKEEYEQFLIYNK